MNKKILFLSICLVIGVAYFIVQNILPASTSQLTTRIIAGSFHKDKLKSEQEWKKLLTPEEFYILQRAGTETPFSGVLNGEKRKGTYYSVGCDVPLFRSEQKYDSGTGWPSFFAPIKTSSVVLRREREGAMIELRYLTHAGDI